MITDIEQHFREKYPFETISISSILSMIDDFSIPRSRQKAFRQIVNRIFGRKKVILVKDFFARLKDAETIV